MTSKKLNYEPMIGDSISNAAKEAITLATKENAPVSFSFNDVNLDVDSNSKPEEVVSLYSKKIREAGEAYRNSPEGKASAARQAKETRETQARLNQTVSELDNALKGGLKTLIPWVKKYAEDADGADYQGDLVLSKLSAAGYKANEYTGKDFVKGNKEVMGRWLVGQVMSCMSDGGPFGKMPPHQVTIKFADDYMAMPDKPATKPAQKLTP